jgi:hypothetical protein
MGAYGEYDFHSDSPNDIWIEFGINVLNRKVDAQVKDVVNLFNGLREAASIGAV